MLYIILIIATLVTSIISGVLSMAGGMILMGVFGFVLSVPAAMVLHGVAQAASNGARIWLHREHVRWSVLPPYTLGTIVVLAVFVAIQFVPDKGIVFILIGITPFLSVNLPARVDLNMERPAVAFLCGLVVTTAQMLAGASGPLLDVFYVRSKLGRREVLGTKAITQTLGHIVKLIYYATLLTQLSVNLPIYVYPAVVIGALIGNGVGKIIVERMSDEQFRKIGSRVIMAVGVVYLAKGAYELMV
jgi:uncharacterized membrane protein YfcA